MNYLLRMEKQELPSTRFHLPPGFGFHPSDQELITHYLQNKVSSHPLPATVIADINLYKYNPWELPKKALFGEDEWYFFSPRDRKYPNGVRPNRAAASGYWKATGIDKPILTFGGRSIGLKKSLVFYTGRPPKGSKTDWIMNEYRLPDQAIKPQRLKGSMRLDDWVLCRVRQKGNVPKYADDHQDMQGLDPVIPPPKLDIPYHESKYLTGMNVDYIYGDWQVKMASLLAGQSPPGIENSSSITFHGSYDSPTTASSVFNHMNTLKRTSADVDVNGDIIQTAKKKREEGYADGDLLCRALVECDTNHYIESQNQELIFNLQPDDPVIDFPEVNDWAWKQMLPALP